MSYKRFSIISRRAEYETVAALQSLDSPQLRLDCLHRLSGHTPPPLIEAFTRENANLLAHDETRPSHTSLRRHDRDMANDLPVGSGQRETNHERRTATIEGINGDDQAGSHSPLLVPANRIEVHCPDIAP